MRQFVFTSDEVETLNHLRREHPTAAVRRKCEVLWMKSQGPELTHAQIARFAGVSLRTTQRYLDEFIAEGLDGVTTVRHCRRPSKLMEHFDLLHDHFLGNPPATVAQARAEIERLIGIRRGLTQVRLFLKATSV